MSLPLHLRRARLCMVCFAAAATMAVAASAGTTSITAASDPAGEMIAGPNTGPTPPNARSPLYWLGLEKSPSTGWYVWSSRTPFPTDACRTPGQWDDLSGHQDYGSILWKGTSVSARAPKFPQNGLFLNEDAPGIGVDLDYGRYPAQFAGKHRSTAGAIPERETVAASGTPRISSSPAASAGVPLPSAALLFPLSVVTAVVAARHLRPGRS
jgi:hypothetical protein